MANLYARLKQKRRLMFQIVFVAITNGYAQGFLKGDIYRGKLKTFCLPGLNCYSCPGAIGSCPIGSLQSVISSRNFDFSFYIVGFLMLTGAIFGKFICGWMCPFGLVQDLLHKIPFKRKLRKLPGDKYLKHLKYFILVVFVIILPIFVVDIIGQGSPWFCSYICPSGTLFASIPLVSSNPSLQAAIGWLFAWKNLVLLVIVLLSIVVYRPFCRYLCPLGAIYGVFNPFALYRFNVDKERCTNCKACQKVCKLDIPVYEKPNSADCIRCGECKDICPHKAISSTLDNLIANKK